MLSKDKNIFIVGIKGVAMTNIAIILKQMGKNVTGWDTDEEFITDKTLRENNISIANALPANTDVVIYSAAHRGHNNEFVQEARHKNVTVITQPQALAEIMQNCETRIAVCGSHGKTTTSAMLSYCLHRLGANPGYMVGTSDFNSMVGGAAGVKKYFVVEADEYAIDPPTDKTAKFLKLNPTHIIATNIDFDHPDVYENIEQTKEVFQQFFNKLDGILRPRLFLCADNTPLQSAVKHLPFNNYITYGYASGATYQIKNPQSFEDHVEFELHHNNEFVDSFALSIFGLHNISNASAVISFLLELNYSAAEIKEVIKSFVGAKRRFEQIAYENDIYLLDDYAHHPVEITATISAAREMFHNKRRVIVIFQPHTYSRTQSLFKEFECALGHADYAYIAPIFTSARESGEEKPALTLQGKNIEQYTNEADLYTRLKEKLRSGDVVFTMGAGDIYKLKNGIIKLIKQAK